MVKRFQSHHLAGERLADEHFMTVPLHMTFLAHLTQRKVIGIGHFGQSLWKRMGRAPVQFAWSASFTQAAMRTLLVVLPAEGIERTLLCTQRASGRFGGGGLERTVHPLMATVLLWLTRLNALRHDSKLEQPHRELAQSTERNTGERDAVVGADRTWQTVLTKHRLETGAGAATLGPTQTLATQQIAAVVVADRQWIAALAIAEPKLAFEVGAPDIVWSADGSERLRMRRHLGTAPTTRQPQAVPLENLAHRAHRRPAYRTLFTTQPRLQGYRSPTRMTPLQRHNGCHLLGHRLIGMAVRRAWAIDQPLTTFRLAALHPFISGRSANIETATQLAHRKFTAPPSAHECSAFFHGTGLLPRHRASSLPNTLTNPVNHVPGFICKQCTRFIPTLVVPAQAGTQWRLSKKHWIPALRE